MCTLVWGRKLFSCCNYFFHAIINFFHAVITCKVVIKLITACTVHNYLGSNTSTHNKLLTHSYSFQPCESKSIFYTFSLAITFITALHEHFNSHDSCEISHPRVRFVVIVQGESVYTCNNYSSKLSRTKKIMICSKSDY